MTFLEVGKVSSFRDK